MSECSLHKYWYIFDERYRTDPDRATVLECFEGTLKEAKRVLRDWPIGSVLVPEEDLHR